MARGWSHDDLCRATSRENRVEHVRHLRYCMSSEATTIHVNFGRPIPLFPLDAVTLFPQQLLPLHIFEPRYRQMLTHALDGPGLIAMAIFDGRHWKQEYHGRPPIKPVVCVGHIAGHEKSHGPEPRYNVILQGVCRARIVKELPADDQRLYRAAYLEPMGIEGLKTGADLVIDDVVDAGVDTARAQVVSMLSEGPLSKLAGAEQLLDVLQNEELPSAAVLDLVTFRVLTEPGIRYRMLAEAEANARAKVLVNELLNLERLAKKAEQQHPESWPKGTSWN